jgi:hypothetical protein
MVKKREDKKKAKYQSSIEKTDAMFRPMVCSTSGAWGKESTKSFKVIGKQIAKQNFTTERFERYKLCAKLTTMVMKTTARSTMRFL